MLRQVYFEGFSSRTHSALLRAGFDVVSNLIENLDSCCPLPRGRAWGLFGATACHHHAFTFWKTSSIFPVLWTIGTSAGRTGVGLICTTWAGFARRFALANGKTGQQLV